MKKITVIVPVYNVENYLFNSFISIKNQTIFDFLKIVIIDDASTDNSYSICEEFYNKNKKNVILLKNEINKGVSYTRNRGLIEVDTDYVTFFDPDDIVTATAYEDLLFLIEKTKADICMTNMAIMIEDKLERKIINKSGRMILNNREATKLFYKSSFIDNSVCNKIFRYSTVKNLKFANELEIAEDMYYIYKSIKSSDKVVLDFDNTNYYYVKRNNSAMNTMSYKKYLDSIKVLDNIIENEEDVSLKELAKFKKVYDKAVFIKIHLESGIVSYNYKEELKNYRKELLNLNIFELLSNFPIKNIFLIFITFISPRFLKKIISFKKVWYKKW